MSEISRGEQAFVVNEGSRDMGDGYRFKEFTIRTPEDEAKERLLPPVPAEAVAADMRSVIATYKGSEPLIGDTLGLPVHLREQLPFTFLGHSGKEVIGDLFHADGEKAILDAEVELLPGTFQPDERSVALLEVIHRLRGAKQFAHNEAVACLRGLEKRSNRWQFKIGQGAYSDFYYTNGADGLSLDPTMYQNLDKDTLDALAEIRGQLGNPATVREAIYAVYGGMPDFNTPVYGNTLGVATLVRSSDGLYMFADRDPRRVAVNAGINCTASGGVLWKPELFEEHSIAGATAEAIIDESDEELNLKMGRVVYKSIEAHVADSLSLDEGDYSISFVGASREIPRGGSPEFFFFTDTKLTAAEVADRIRKNTNPDKMEAKTVLALPEDNLFKLLDDSNAARIIHPKSLLNAVFIREYLKHR